MKEASKSMAIATKKKRTQTAEGWKRYLGQNKAKKLGQKAIKG